jgi:quinoprotein glucose dehydrogenase
LASALSLRAAGEVEDPAARARLPLYQMIPAATAGELTPASGQPVAASLRTWTVSHGDAGSRRYSALSQINRDTVKRLTAAWTYHSGDGMGNIQCNPIVVDGVMYGPTPGRAIVALDATTGREQWRFQVEKPERVGLEDAPARRGLVFWPGNSRHGARVVFASGRWLYALDPKSGRPMADFGSGAEPNFQPEARPWE